MLLSWLAAGASTLFVAIADAIALLPAAAWYFLIICVRFSARARKTAHRHTKERFIASPMRRNLAGTPLSTIAWAFCRFESYVHSFW
jgi:hypothetical protein